MNFIKTTGLLSLMVFLSGCANQNFKAEEPIDYKDNAKYGFGSLIKDKDSVFKKYFSKSSDEKEKISIEKVKSDSKSDDLWTAAIVALKDFPIEFMDKKSGKIETEKVKIKEFDNTGSCTYKITVTVLNDKDINVIVDSTEDSKLRLKKHSEILKSKILSEYKK